MLSVRGRLMGSGDWGLLRTEWGNAVPFRVGMVHFWAVDLQAVETWSDLEFSGRSVPIAAISEWNVPSG